MNIWGLWGFHRFSIFSSVLETQLPILRTWLLKPNLLSTSDASSSISKNSKYIRRYQCFFFHPQISGVAADSGVFFSEVYDLHKLLTHLLVSEGLNPVVAHPPSGVPKMTSHEDRLSWRHSPICQSLGRRINMTYLHTCNTTRPSKKIKKNKWVYANFPPSSENDDDTPWDFGPWYRQTGIYIYQKKYSLPICKHIYTHTS